ncbi:MAG TPA: hypothetical protein VGF28_02780 [Thermoanaerobaculia bacterium]|jgi:hypothetical protein
MRLRIYFTLAMTSLLCASVMTAQTTESGLFFTISNGCSAPVTGFAVGDEVCLLKVGSAVFTRAIFQGNMLPGEQKFSMACAGKDGNGSIIFVPPAGTSMSAVVVSVKPEQVVAIPKTFCPEAAAERQLLRKR